MKYLQVEKKIQCLPRCGKTEIIISWKVTNKDDQNKGDSSKKLKKINTIQEGDDSTRQTIYSFLGWT